MKWKKINKYFGQLLRFKLNFSQKDLLALIDRLFPLREVRIQALNIKCIRDLCLLYAKREINA